MPIHNRVKTAAANGMILFGKISIVAFYGFGLVILIGCFAPSLMEFSRIAVIVLTAWTLSVACLVAYLIVRAWLRKRNGDLHGMFDLLDEMQGA